MDNNNDVILVSVSDAGQMRGKTPKPIKVEVLAENVQIFMGQMDSMMKKTPENVGGFKLSEFTVTVEVSAKGQLSLLGTGGELAGGGGLTFKFERK